MKTLNTKTTNLQVAPRISEIDIAIIYSQAFGLPCFEPQDKTIKSTKNPDKPLGLKIILIVNRIKHANYLRSVLKKVGRYKKVTISNFGSPYILEAYKNIMVDSINSELIYSSILAKGIEGVEFFGCVTTQDAKTKTTDKK